MAIRMNRIKKALSDEQVRSIRKEFFLDLETLKGTAFRYGVSMATVKDAIHGKGYYQNISDDIPQETKETRLQARTVNATPKSKRAREKRLAEKSHNYGN